jgi:hypothetical protein
MKMLAKKRFLKNQVMMCIFDNHHKSIQQSVFICELLPI